MKVKSNDLNDGVGMYPKKREEAGVWRSYYIRKRVYSRRSGSREVDWEKDDREEMPCTLDRVLWYGIEV